MDFGIATLPTDETIDPRELARAAEAMGFESFFVGEHSHVPVDHKSPFPSPPYNELPRHYYRILDPFVTLAMVASVTTNIKLGTGICLVVTRDPIFLAKEAATLDLISGGRLLLGVGSGWNREEMENHGTDPKTRMALLAERVKAIKTIWTEEKAEFHGRFVNFDPIYQWPKPVQKPHPPILVGGGGPTVLDRVLEFGDGWFPGHHKGVDKLELRIRELQERAAAMGRAPIPVTIHLVEPMPALYARYEEIGVSRCVLMVEPADRDGSLRQLDDFVRGIEAYRRG